MAKIACPNCGARATNVSLLRGSKYFCSNCGWNGDVAARMIQSDVHALYLVMAFGIVLVASSLYRNPEMWWGPAALAMAFIVFPASFVLLGWIRQRRIKGLLIRIKSVNVDEAEGNEDRRTKLTGQQPTAAEALEISRLELLPRPRKVRLTRKGRTYSVLILALVGLNSYFQVPIVWQEWRRGSFSWQRDWVLCFWAVLVYLYAGIFLRNRIRERELLADGRIALGSVVSQTNNKYTQSIQYTFQDSARNSVTSYHVDASRSLYEGMKTTVFYDENDPKRNVPLKCALTKIVSI